MKVFITWSGDQSKQIAQALRSFIPNLLQAVEAFMSEEDIDKGTKWQSSLSSELDSSAMGVICLTPENITAPWILFEAGALSKKMADRAEARVYTYLHKLEKADVTFPLAMFQHTLANREETRLLLQSIRKHTKTPSPTEEGLNGLFAGMWPVLEEKLNKVAAPAAAVPRRPDDMIQEVLELVRGISKAQQEQLMAIIRMASPFSAIRDRRYSLADLAAVAGVSSGPFAQVGRGLGKGNKLADLAYQNKAPNTDHPNEGQTFKDWDSLLNQPSENEKAGDD